jgi:argininosuccinate synthase
MSKVVMACFGDAASTAAIEQWAMSADVIAVALDFGGAVTLNDMRDLAVAAGAVRCHALDVREEFAREILVPASRAGRVTDPAAAIRQLAAPLVASKLQEIALAVHVASRPVSRAIEPLYVNIRFEAGVPVAINGVDMMLTELLESLETITGEPALAVLQRVGRGELTGPAESPRV